MEGGWGECVVSGEIELGSRIFLGGLYICVF